MASPTMIPCKGCRYWSEMIAKAEGGGGVQALCLNHRSPNHGEYTFGGQGCAEGERGPAIDDPDP